MARIDEKTREQRKERVWLKVRSSSNGIREAEIADELRMERRTVNNYLRELEIEGRIIKDGRLWYPAPWQETRLRPFELAPEEALTLYLGTRLLVKQHDKRNEPAETALLKVAQALRDDAGVGREIEQAARELAQRPIRQGYQPVFRNVVRAYIYRKKVRLSYKPLNWKEPFETLFSTYLIEPSLIGSAIYIIGHSSAPNALRAYKLGRIQSAELTAEGYVIPDDFPGLPILRNAWNIMTGEETIQVVLRFSPRVRERVEETIWHPSEQKFADPEKEGWLRWTAEIANTQDILPWIRSWGADCEVVGPEQLRKETEHHIRTAMKQYRIHTPGNTLDDRLLLLWGKTPKRNSDVYHPALYHLMDVAHVAQWLLGSRASSRWRRVLGNALNTSPDTLHEWLPFIIALHDLGKLSPLFQMLNDQQAQRLKNAGLEFPAVPKDDAPRHTVTGDYLLPSLFPEWPARFKEVLRAMIRGHHGTYPEISRSTQRFLHQKFQEADEWKALRARALTLLESVFLLKKPDAWPEPEN
ncbi:CRISPR-associated endonuclease Cas3'', partial [Candidatus Parcubacteria bacterium]